jgi:hypothetical protein
LERIDRRRYSARWWHIMYSLAAGVLAGIAFPLRRYGLTITNEPVFFAAIVAIVSLVGAVPYGHLASKARPDLASKSNYAFLCVWFLRRLRRVIRADGLKLRTRGRRLADSCDDPIVESIDRRSFFTWTGRYQRSTIAGTISVFLGTIAIALGK